MKSIQGQGIMEGPFALFSSISWPPKFKMPEFEKYDGTSNPIVNLRLYIAKMEEYIESEKRAQL